MLLWLMKKKLIRKNVCTSIFTVESCGFGGCLQASTKAGMGGGGTLNFGGGGSNEGQSSFVFVSAAMELMAKAPRAAAAFSAMLHADMHSYGKYLSIHYKCVLIFVLSNAWDQRSAPMHHRACFLIFLWKIPNNITQSWIHVADGMVCTVSKNECRTPSK